MFGESYISMYSTYTKHAPSARTSSVLKEEKLVVILGKSRSGASNGCARIYGANVTANLFHASRADDCC